MYQRLGTTKLKAVYWEMHCIVMQKKETSRTTERNFKCELEVEEDVIADKLSVCELDEWSKTPEKNDKPIRHLEIVHHWGKTSWNIFVRVND